MEKETKKQELKGEEVKEPKQPTFQITITFKNTKQLVFSGADAKFINGLHNMLNDKNSPKFNNIGDFIINFDEINHVAIALEEEK